jgi:hypothetical protein
MEVNEHGILVQLEGASDVEVCLQSRTQIELQQHSFAGDSGLHRALGYVLMIPNMIPNQSVLFPLPFVRADLFRDILSTCFCLRNSRVCCTIE